MNRRSFTSKVLGLFAVGVGVKATASEGHGCGVADKDGPLIRLSSKKDDIGWMDGAEQHVGITFNGEEDHDHFIMTLDERGGFIIGWRKDEEPSDIDWGVGNKIYGNFSITGLTKEQREAHLDRMNNRVLMDSKETV